MGIAEEYYLLPCHSPCEYLSRGTPRIAPADQIRSQSQEGPSDNADLDSQAVDPAVCIMQLNIVSRTQRQQEHVI